ncbi:MAG TPA: LapA family protein [Nitrospirales bacterium]|nr:LapA family protein [Nitrospirales bacterium]
MIRLILVVILVALSVTFFLQNHEEQALLHYFGITSKAPIYRPILSAFGTGLLIMGILLFPAWIKLRIELRRTRNALHLAEEELDRLRPPRTPTLARSPLVMRENPEDEDAP